MSQPINSPTSPAKASLARKINPVSLVSLSLLMVNAKDKKGDYLDYLLPFLIHIINKEQSDGTQALKDTSLHKKLVEQFGLTIPVQTVELCLKRLCSRKLLSFSRLYKTYIITSDFPVIDINLQWDICLKRLDTVIDALTVFSAKSFELAWTRQQAITAITDYLSHYGIDSLRAYVGRSSVPTVHQDKADIFVVNAFIRDIQEFHLELFNAFSELVQGQMLSNALLCPDIRQISQRFQNLTLFLDTPFVLRLLDLDSESSYQAAKETIDLARRLGCRIAIFSHTSDEIQSVVQACSRHLNNPNARGRLIREMRTRKTSSEELLLLAFSLDLSYANLNITVIETPDHLAEFTIDEAALENALDEDISYFTERALFYDIKSIQSVYTLREGKRPTSLENSSAVLVTTNAALARSAYLFGQRFESSREVSTVITSFSFSNIAWLKGSSLSTTLPELEMLALAYAALRPSNTLWEKVIKTADDMKRRGLGTAEDHLLIRFSPSVQSALMNLTLGEEQRVTEHTIEQLIESAHSEVLSKERIKHRQELKQYESVKSGEIANLEDQKSQLSTDIEQLLSSRHKVLEKLGIYAKRIGSLTKWISIVGAFCAYLAVAYGLDKILPLNPKWKHIVSMLLFVASTAITFNGGVSKRWATVIGDWVSNKSLIWLSARFLPEIQLKTELPRDPSKS